MTLEHHLRRMPHPDFHDRLKDELLRSTSPVPLQRTDARRIGILADTHCDDRRPLPDTVVEALAGCELIVHCGDITAISVLDRLESIAPVLAVRGDTDKDPDPRIADGPRVIQAGPFRIGITFNLKPSANRPDLPADVPQAFGGPVDLLVSAATHLADLRRTDGVWFLNPGSPTLPADGRKTIAIVEIGDTLHPQLIEL